MLDRNLLPGQYQIGNFVFGAHTMFRVESCDIGAYELNVKDYQRGSADELSFGEDTLKPMPLTLTINALNNYAMPHIASLMKDFKELNFDNDRQPGIFAREWRADETRHKWGELKPLKVCRPKDGVTLRVYGRPGKLAVTPLGRAPNNQNRQMVAEFRRSDTLYYSDYEYLTSTKPNEIQTIVRNADHDMGDAPSWLRFLLVGPMTHPIIQLGFVTIELDYAIPAGSVVEISSYPWARRAIDLSSGISLNARLTQPYLDKLLFETNSKVEFSWNASGLRISGNDVEEDFSAYDLTMLHDKWHIFYMGPGQGEIAPKIQLLPALPLIHAVLAWHDSGNRWRLGTAIFKRGKTISDWQKVGMQIGIAPEPSLFEEECANRIIGRSNADGTRYQYWDIRYPNFIFGIHIDGTDHEISKTYKIPRILAVLENIIDNFKGAFGAGDHAGAGWYWEAEFGSGEDLNTHTLWINGHRVCVFRNANAWGFTGKDYRHYGFGMKATQRLLGQSTPGPLVKFWGGDNYPPSIAEEIIKEAEEQANIEYGSVRSRCYLLWRDAWQTL